MDRFPIDVSGVSLYIDIDFDIDMELVTTPILYSSLSYGSCWIKEGNVLASGLIL